MFKKDAHALPGIEKLNTLIGENTIFEGNIKVEGSVKIDGNFYGNISTEGDVFIGERAEMHGDIWGNDIIIAGKLDGNVEAQSHVTMKCTAKVKGNIRTCGFIVDVGSIFNGNCTIMENKDNGKIGSFESAKMEKTLKLVE